MKRKLPLILLACAAVGTYFLSITDNNEPNKFQAKTTLKKKKKTEHERMLYVQERLEHELKMQRDPSNGEIPLEEKRKEYENALVAKQKVLTQKTTSSTYTSRGPSNLGGRTRAFAIDISDNTSNTMLAGGVSSGMFRSTDGGASWTKVSANDEIHNVTSIAQDTRAGFQDTWYYSTGEFFGNSASLGGFYFGKGVWKSTDGGLTWAIIPGTDSNFTSFDSDFDIINKIVVSPITGDLFIATLGGVYRYDGTNLTLELDETSAGNDWSDVVVTGSGRVYVAIDGNSSSENGVWTSPTGNGSWTRIAQNGTPSSWSSQGRIVLGAAPSNDDVIYALYVNGVSGGIEADLWKYDHSTTTWTDFSSKLPDEPGGNLVGNDPFAVNGGYDLVIEVKPDNENFVVIGGTNVYRIEDIINETTFVRIGGYMDNGDYALYDIGGVEHHPDIHSLVFDPNNSNILFSGTDGGVHRTDNISAATIPWVNLNNNYNTYQYYHVAIDPFDGSNIVFGGTQDNGTVLGGTDAGLPNNTEKTRFFGGDGVSVGIARRNGNQDLQFYYGSQLGNMVTNYPFQRTIAPSDVDLINGDGLFVTYFYLDPDNTSTLYYALDNVLYRTNDAENVTRFTWTNVGGTSTSENIRTVTATRGTYNASSSYLLIGGDRGGIFRLDDPHNAANISSAINITPSGATTSSGTVVSGLAIHPTNPDIVLAVYANYGASVVNIFLTTNATSANPTWTNVEQNLDAHSIRSAAITQVGSEIIYFVGTARGLYSSNDPTSKDWDIEGINQIGLAVVSGLVYRPSDNKLLIGTHGNGMYETTVENTLSNDTFAQGELGITMYPNPAQFELNFISDQFDLSTQLDYRISDVTGKLIKQGVLNDRKVDVSNMTPGIYLISFQTEGKKQTLKFIKN